MQVHIHPLVTIYINTLLAWTKCFLATYGVYPGLYDLLDTPRRDFLATQLHLRDFTLPMPLLHRSRGPPTLRSELICSITALPSPSPPPDHLYVCRTTRPSFTMSVSHATSPSVIPTAPTVCLSTCKSVALSIHPMASLSVVPTHPSYEQSVHPPVTPSMTRQSITPPVSPVKRLSDRPSPSDRLYTILPHPSGCPTSSDHTSTTYTSPSDHLPLSHHLYNAPISLSACPSPADCLTATTTPLTIHPSFPTIHHTQDSIHSLAIVNGEQSHTIHCTQDSNQSSSHKWGAIPQGQEIP